MDQLEQLEAARQHGIPALLRFAVTAMNIATGDAPDKMRHGWRHTSYAAQLIAASNLQHTLGLTELQAARLVTMFMESD